MPIIYLSQVSRVKLRTSIKRSSIITPQKVGRKTYRLCVSDDNLMAFFTIRTTRNLWQVLSLIEKGEGRGNHATAILS